MCVGSLLSPIPPYWLDLPGCALCFLQGCCDPLPLGPPLRHRGSGPLRPAAGQGGGGGGDAGAAGGRGPVQVGQGQGKRGGGPVQVGQGQGQGKCGGGGQGLQQHLSQGMVLHGQGGVQDAYPISEVRGCVSQGVPHHDCFPCLPAGSMWPALCRSPYSTSPPAQRQQQGSSRHQQGRAPATPGSSTRRLSSMSWAGGGRLLGL